MHYINVLNRNHENNNNNDNDDKTLFVYNQSFEMYPNRAFMHPKTLPGAGRVANMIHCNCCHYCTNTTCSANLHTNYSLILASSLMDAFSEFSWTPYVDIRVLIKCRVET